MDRRHRLLALAGAALVTALGAAVQGSGHQPGVEEGLGARPAPGPPAFMPAGAAYAGRPGRSGSAPSATAPAATWRSAPPEPQDPEDHLAVNAAQRLMANETLLAVFAHYLQRQAGPGDKADLLAYLKSRLPAPAYEDARQLVGRYIDYLQFHDRQLRSQWPGADRPSDLLSIGTWVAQRQQLRLGMLGPEATQGLYQNESAALGQALDELVQRQRGPAAELLPGAAPVPHWTDPAAEAEHVQYLRNLLRSTMTALQSQRPESAALASSQAVAGR